MMTLKFTAASRILRTIAVGGAALTILLSAGGAQAQISVSPVILPISVETQAVTRTISVTNSGNAPVSVRFYAGDFDQAERGEHQFAEPGTLPNSCGDRLRVYPDGASLLPGETQSVRVDMEPGVQTCWSAVFVENTGVTADGTLVRQRIAAKIYGVRPDARVEGEVTRVVTQKDDSVQQLAVTFRNLGDAPLRPEGTLEIRSFTGDVVAKAPIDAFSVLPGRDRTVEIAIPAIGSAGEFIAIPVLDFGGAHLAGGQVTFILPMKDVKGSSKTPTLE